MENFQPPVVWCTMMVNELKRDKTFISDEYFVLALAASRSRGVPSTETVMRASSCFVLYPDCSKRSFIQIH
ncbi:unnamed protein product [Calypogeia fissa]